MAYNLQNIRTLLTEGFSDEQLRRFCFDEPAFRPVYDELAGLTGKAAIIDQLLEHADRTLQLDRILTWAKKQNPSRYERHKPYHEDELPKPPQEPAAPAKQPQTARYPESGTPLTDEDLKEMRRQRGPDAPVYSGPAPKTPVSTPVASPPVPPRETADPQLMALRAQPWIFLCHAKEDKPQVADLYRRLKAAGYHPWLDKYDLLPGQDWRREIEKIIRDPYNLVLVCLSNNSITKRGVVQQEIKWALDVLDQQPEDTIYMIPARLEVCEAPERLSHLQWVNLFEPDGFDNLKRALNFEISKRQPSPQPFEPEPQPSQSKLKNSVKIVRVQPRYRLHYEPDMFLIPAGEFLMGSDPKKDKQAEKNEQPQHTVYLPDFYIAKTPVTNEQYEAFVQTTGYQPPDHWVEREPPKGKYTHPVVQVSWFDTQAYCQWLTEATSRNYRLPTEAEWEKAARGTDGLIYPWGNKWDARRCNAEDASDTTAVGAYPKGVSPYGLLDMAGNVWEWTFSLWGKNWEKPDFYYPYDPIDGRESVDISSSIRRVLRGGSFNNTKENIRCAYRISNFPSKKGKEMGFRVAASPSQ